MLPNPLAEIEQQQRDLVVAVARTWLRTPFHRKQELRGAGADCATLINGIMGEAGVFHDDELHTMPYGMDGANRDNRELYLERLSLFCGEISQAEAGPGDIIVSRVMGYIFNHGGVILDWPNVMHCIAAAGTEIVNAERNPFFFCRDVKFFSPWRRDA